MATRELKVEIIGDSSSLEHALGRASKTSSGLGRALKTLGKTALIGAGAAFAGLAVVAKNGFDELSEGQKVAAQTEAGLKSTGRAANVTAKEIDALAQSQSALTGIDDEAIQAGENMLLTFTNIRNEVGKGNDIFNQATVAVENLATRMADGAVPSMEQLSKGSIKVGKALNDPVKGMTALGKVGVYFSDSQKKAIEAMVKAGDVMGAQKIILKELTTEFGGSAEAAGTTLPGQLAKLRNSFDNVSAGVAEVLLPYLTAFLDWANRHMPEIQAGLQGAMEGIAWTIENVLKPALDGIVAAFRWLAEKAEEYWPRIRAAAEAVATWYKNNLEPTLVSVSRNIAAAWRGSGEDSQATTKQHFGAIPPLVRAQMENVVSVVNTILALLRGDWRTAWREISEIPGRMLRAAVDTIRTIVNTARAAAMAVGTAILQGLSDGIKGVPGAVRSGFRALPGILAGLAADAYGWAKGIGEAIIRGIGDGISGLVGWLLDQASGVVGRVKDRLEFWRSPPGEYGSWLGSEVIGGMAKGMKDKGSEVAEAARKVVEEAKRAVESAQGDFASAFGELASVAMQAFDAVVQAWVAPSQKILDRMNLKDEIASAKQAIVDAQAELNAARAAAATEATPENIAAVQAAERALAEARRNERKQQLARDAAEEEAKHAKDVERDRIHFKDRLGKLQAELARFTKSGGELTAGEQKKYRAHLNDLLKDFGIDAKFWGSAIGISLADGLRQAQGTVRKAALVLAREIQKLLKTKSPAEEGPLSDLDKWWDTFGETLASGLDFGPVHRAITGGLSIARRLLTGGAGEGLAGGAGLAGFGDMAKTEFGKAETAKDSYADDVEKRSPGVEAGLAAQAAAVKALGQENLAVGYSLNVWGAMADAVKKTSRDSSSPLSTITEGMNNLAVALDKVRAYLYGLRNAARDTLPEIWGLFKQHPVVPPNLFLSQQSVAARGSVAARATTTLGGGGMVVNLTINGSVLTEGQLVETVRRGLYNVSRRNPGALPGVA